MAQIKQTNKNGVTYVYDVQYYWDKEKQQSRSKKKLIGKIDPETQAIIPTRGMVKKAEKEKEQQAQLAILKQIKRQKFGATYALQKIARLTGVYQDLKAVFGQTAQDILNIAYYLILNPTNSLKQFATWQEDQFQPTGSKPLSSQRLSELLKTVTEAHKQSFFQRQADRQPEDAIWFYDTTSISSYSQLLSQVKYGFNKEHDSLPQINLAMVFNETTGLPIMYRQLNGNIPDHQTIPWLLALFDDLPTQDIHLALDRGFYSKQSIQYLLQEDLAFIMGGKTSVKYIQNAIDQVSDCIESPAHYSKNYKLYMTQVKTDQFKASETSHYPVTLHIYYDIEKVADERKCFDETLLARFERLKLGKQEKEDMIFNKKFFRKEESSGETIYLLNEPAIFQHKRRLGYFVLLSNTEMSSREVLEHYRNKDMIEKAFHDLKDRLNLRRVRVKSDRTLEGKLFVQYIALLFLSYLKRCMERHNLYEAYTLDELLRELNRVECFDHPEFGFTLGEITTKQKDLFNQLGITVPQQ